MLFDFLFPKRTETGSHVSPVVLMILDGFGLAPLSSGNAIAQANMPFYRSLLNQYPNGELIASGESVGLPANEVGNTEVGHLTLGSGRVIFQDLKRIDRSIETGSFFDNKAFVTAAFHAKKHNSKLHLVGLVGSGNVHSSKRHLYSLLQFCKKEEVGRVYMHLFTDGRDSPPKEAAELLKGIQDYASSLGVGKIATVCGRYFGMDRDRRWDRTKKAYDMLTLGRGKAANSLEDEVSELYKQGITDEFIEPIVADNTGLIEDNDAVCFFNFRIDRARQITMPFVVPDFENPSSQYLIFGSKESGEARLAPENTFKREKVLKNIFSVTMTQYQESLPVSLIAFGPELIEDTLTEVISRASLRQAHMAESEKQRFVTYYFDGMRERSVSGEDVLIVPSQKVATYDLKPEMSLPELTREFCKAVDMNLYKFIVINVANPDMVAHSGNLKASIKACEFVDRYLKEMTEKVLSKSGVLIITADHGNAEELLTYPTSSYFVTTSEGVINTDHSNNPVPVVFVSQALKNKNVKTIRGSLADIAPSVLGLLNIAVPEKMTGKNLLSG